MEEEIYEDVDRSKMGPIGEVYEEIGRSKMGLIAEVYEEVDRSKMGPIGPPNNEVAIQGRPQHPPNTSVLYQPSSPIPVAITYPQKNLLLQPSLQQGKFMPQPSLQQGKCMPQPSLQQGPIFSVEGQQTRVVRQERGEKEKKEKLQLMWGCVLSETIIGMFCCCCCILALIGLILAMIGKSKNDRQANKAAHYLGLISIICGAVTWICVIVGFIILVAVVYAIL